MVDIKAWRVDRHKTWIGFIFRVMIEESGDNLCVFLELRRPSVAVGS